MEHAPTLPSSGTHSESSSSPVSAPLLNVTTRPYKAWGWVGVTTFVFAGVGAWLAEIPLLILPSALLVIASGVFMMWAEQTEMSSELILHLTPRGRRSLTWQQVARVETDALGHALYFWPRDGGDPLKTIGRHDWDGPDAEKLAVLFQECMTRHGLTLEVRGAKEG